MENQLFEPTFLNLEYVFYKITQLLLKIWDVIISIFTDEVLGAFIRFILVIAIIALVAFIIYTLMKIKKIENDESIKISDIKAPKDDRSVKNERWEKIKRIVETNNPAEWKVAIFEAYSIFEEMTQKMQIKGDTLGDRLKNAEPSDFQTLQNAWAAHKIRNNIAHQGGTFELSHKDAQEAIKNFEVVFQEFDYI